MSFIKSSGISTLSIRWRRLINKPLRVASGVFLQRGIKLLRNGYIPNGKPTVYVATHVFYDDIASIFNCLKQHAYLLFAVESADNFPEVVVRVAFFLNGVIGVKRNNKQSRADAFNKMVKLLKNEGNILVFPEGIWNFTPNKIVQKLNWGAVRVAEYANANIVPIAVEIVGDEYGVIVGSVFDYQKYTNAQQATEELRDTMATLAWELISMNPPLQRKDLTDEYWLKHVRDSYKRMPRKDQSKEEEYIYRPKGEVSLGEVLAEMHGIEYKSMAADYETHKRIEKLITNWVRS